MTLGDIETEKERVIARHTGSRVEERNEDIRKRQKKKKKHIEKQERRRLRERLGIDTSSDEKRRRRGDGRKENKEKYIRMGLLNSHIIISSLSKYTTLLYTVCNIQLCWPERAYKNCRYFVMTSLYTYEVRQ